MPNPCTEAGTKCHVHFAFHGEEDIGIDLANEKTQLNNFAAKNNIIMAYPRSYGAWDAYGDFSPDYATINGPYPQVIMNILELLAKCEITQNE